MKNRYNTLSANSLFHFTSSFDNLASILTNEFYPRYCPEDHSAFHTKRNNYYINYKRAIPMVCFCDIPLSQIRNHIKIYGHYAIGLSKTWGIKNKVSPVMYITPNSNSSTCLRECFDYLVNKLLNRIASPPKLDIKSEEHADLVHKIINMEHAIMIQKLDNIIYYTKSYEGTFMHNNKLHKKVRFYDEREWRYIPDLVLLMTELSMSEENIELLYKTKEIVAYIPNDDLLDDKVKNDLNTNIAKHCSLSFTPSDIKYIVVKNDAEILRVVDKLTDTKLHKYDAQEVKLLKTRIISTEQILEDF